MFARRKVAPPEERKGTPPIRVLLVDDSNVVRSIFARVLADCGQVEIVGEAASSAEALQHLKRQRADIILLDIEMPERTGLDALPEILDAAAGARVLVVSAFVEENGPAAIRALSLGACDTLSKPGRFGFSGKFSETLIEKVVRLGRSAKAPSSRPGEQSSFPAGRMGQGEAKPHCVAIGASTGGIPVIYEIVRSLPQTLDCPVFITQHLPDAFMEFFARQLQSQTQKRVCVAVAGDVVADNTIYISPGDAHLVCQRDGGRVVIGHLRHYAGSRYSPSVDALLESVAEIYGQNALAIILSGMGNDGAQGATRLAAKQARIFVQDEESSVVWGMPGAIARAGLATAIMPPAHLTRYLHSCVRD